MSDRRVLSEANPSAALLLWQVESEDAAQEVMRWREEGLTVRTVRGRKMRSVDALFDEVSAALQFPGYFGENWPAFNECLSEMDWLPAGVGVVIVLTEAGEVLIDDHEAELGALVRAMARAASTYAEPIERGEWWDRPAVPFHVVVSVPPAEAEPVRSRWAGAGATFSEFDP
jgi:RNAse (barnase) inhibitor barstar